MSTKMLDCILKELDDVEKIQVIDGVNINDQHLDYDTKDIPKNPFSKKVTFSSISITDFLICHHIRTISLNSIICILVHVPNISMMKK